MRDLLIGTKFLLLSGSPAKLMQAFPHSEAFHHSAGYGFAQVL